MGLTPDLEIREPLLYLCLSWVDPFLLSAQFFFFPLQGRIDARPLIVSGVWNLTKEAHKGAHK